MASVLSTSRYRCLVGHLMYWKRGLKEAMEDCGVEFCHKSKVIEELFAAGYEYDEEEDTLTYTA